MSEATGNVVDLVSGISGDVFGVLGLIVLLVAFGLSKGKDNLIVMMIALYPSALITEYFPFYNQISIGSGSLGNVFPSLLIFTVVAVATFFVFRNYVDTNYQHHGFWRAVEIISLSLANVGLTIAFLYHIVGIEAYYNFSFVFDTLFASNLAMFTWLLLPIVSIPLFIRA